VNPNDRPVDHPRRSEEGLRRGGHTRAVGQTQWGDVGGHLKVPNAPAGDAAYTNIGSHAPKPPKPLQPGASEASPRGERAAGAPTPRVATEPRGMKGRR
jgi:hypothetical protein